MKRLGGLLEVGIPAILILAFGATAAFAGGWGLTGSSDATVGQTTATLAPQAASPVADATVRLVDDRETFPDPEVTSPSTETTVTTGDDEQVAENQDAQGNQQIGVRQDVSHVDEDRNDERPVEHEDEQHSDEHEDDQGDAGDHGGD
jgi:hypothetical protein